MMKLSTYAKDVQGELQETDQIAGTLHSLESKNQPTEEQQELSSFASQMDTLQIKKKHAEAEAALSIFCPQCRDKHPKRECPLDRKPICTICDKDHDTQNYPSLPGIKAALQPTDEEAEAVYLMTQRRQWQPRGQGMNSNMPFNRWNNYSAYNQMSYPPSIRCNMLTK